MSIPCEIQCSLTKSRSDDTRADEDVLHKNIGFAYKREYLLSLAELDTCKRLPRGFDSSILDEVNNASVDLSQWCSSDSGQKATFTSRESGCVAGVSAPKFQRSELNGASTDLPESSNDIDSGKWDNSSSQHSQQNPGCGLLVKDNLLTESGCPVGDSPTVVQGSIYHLLNRSVTPYRPPHFYKMNLHWRTKSKDLSEGKTFGHSKCPSLGRQEERNQGDSLELMRKRGKPIEGKQHLISDELKENLDPGVLKGSRNDKGILGKFCQSKDGSKNEKGVLGKCYQSKESAVASAPNNDRHCSSIQASACRGNVSLTFLGRSVEKGSQTISISNPHLQEHDNVEMDQTENNTLSSSNFIDQFIEEEKKPSGGFSMIIKNHATESYTEPNRRSGGQPENLAEDLNESTSFSCHKSEVPQKLVAPTTCSTTEEVPEQLCSSDASLLLPDDLRCEEIVHSILSDASEHYLPQRQCIQPYDLEEQSNTANHSGPSQFLALSKKGIDKIDLATAPSNLKSSSAWTTGYRHDHTCDISMGNETGESEVYMDLERNANNAQSKSVSSETNAFEVYIASAKISNQQDSSCCAQRSGLPQKLMAATTQKVSEQACSPRTSVVPPGVPMCKETEKSTALEVIENHFSQHQCVECYDIEKSQTNTASHSGSSQHLIDLLKKGKDATDLTGWLMLNSSDARTTRNLVVSEHHSSQHQCLDYQIVENTQLSTASHSGSSQHLNLLNKSMDAADMASACSNINSSRSRTTENWGRNLICEPKHGAGLTMELQSISSARLSEYDFLSDIDFPSPLDSEIIHLPMDELIGVNHETFTSLFCAKRTDLNESRFSDLVCNEFDNKIELHSPSEQVTELEPEGGFDEKANAVDEICLPDEDSLITLDDLVLQMDSVLMADGNATDADVAMTASRTPEPATLRFSLDDCKSLSSLKTATLTSNDAVDSKISFDNIGARQSDPSSHTNSKRPLFPHSEVRSSASKVHFYGPGHHSIFRSFPQQMTIPGGFPQQLSRQPIDPHSDQMIHHLPWPNQNIIQTCEQQIYGISNTGHYGPIGGNSNQAVVGDRKGKATVAMF